MGGIIIKRECLLYKKCTDQTVDTLISLLKRRFQTSSKWSIEKVDISKIIPLCKHVYSERLLFAKKSISNCILSDIPLFYPYMVQYDDNAVTHLIVPPIVEERNQLLYLGDGMHRIYTLLELNILTAYVLVTHECVLPLPGKPQNWNNVKVNSIQLPGHMNFEDFEKAGLTGYSKFCNSDTFWMHSGE